MVEATGVELITMLTAPKLLILGTARTAKKASLPNPLYVYCTKISFAFRLVKSLPQSSIPWVSLLEKIGTHAHRDRPRV
jgi:hypothetical protein